ncbi:MAG: PEP-CTERM sorting domain-containing protein [Burkholderiales bacterium]
MKKMIMGAALALVAIFPTVVLAGAFTPIPEPGILPLIGIGAVACIAIFSKGRRK